MYTPSLNSIVWIFFSGNGRKPPFGPTLSYFWSLEGQNWSNIAQKWIISEDSHNMCTPHAWNRLCEHFSDNGRKPPFWPIFSHFLSTRGPKLGQLRPKANHYWALTQQMPTPNLRGIDWLFFEIMVRNPGETDTQMDAHHSYNYDVAQLQV